MMGAYLSIPAPIMGTFFEFSPPPGIKNGNFSPKWPNFCPLWMGFCIYDHGFYQGWTDMEKLPITDI